MVGGTVLRRGLGIGAVLAALCGVGSTPAAAQQGVGVDPSRLCLDPMTRLEREHDIAPGLLEAIARTESGRRNPKTGDWAPWPWTINAEGTPFYFQSKDEAVKAVQGLMLQGVTSIDIGCMQISLHWHNEKFTTLDDIFDPITNITYAAEHLRGLYEQHGTWHGAAGYYHSATRELRTAYLRRVLGYWRRGDLADAALVTGGDGSGPLARATAAYEAGDFKDALVLYDEVLEMTPDDRIAHQGRATVLDALGYDMDALQAWHDLLAMSPGNGVAQTRLITWVRTLPPADALTAAQDLWRVAPKEPAILSLLGETYARLGRTDQALDMHLAAQRSAPTSPLPALNAAVMLDREGRKREALSYYTRFLDLYRADPVPLTLPLETIRARVNWLRRHAGG